MATGRCIIQEFGYFMNAINIMVVCMCVVVWYACVCVCGVLVRACVCESCVCRACVPLQGEKRVSLIFMRVEGYPWIATSSNEEFSKMKRIVLQVYIPLCLQHVCLVLPPILPPSPKVPDPATPPTSWRPSPQTENWSESLRNLLVGQGGYLCK